MKTFPILAALVITLAVGGPAAAKNTPITTCPFVISAPGHYFLAADLGPCAGPFAIQIAADHVHLRLEGHTIAGAAGFATDGISADGVQKIKIDGPGTITSCRFGIHWQNVDHSDVSKVTARGNATGFIIGGGSDNRFTDNVASGNGFSGMGLTGVTNSRLVGNVANNNELHTGIAIVSGGGNKLTGNTANGNSLAEFPICSIAGGISVASSGNEIAENTTNGNCSQGIGIFSGTENRVVQNTALGNHGFDLFDANPDCDANQWVANIFVTSNQGCIH